MLDPAFVRDHLDVVRERLAARGTRMDAELDALAALDAERRTLIPKVEELKRQQNASGEEVARAKKAGQDASHLFAANKARGGEIKALEARKATRDGASEIDMVINIGALKSKDEALVLRDIRAVVEASRDGRALSKVIFETALLTDDEKVRACELSMRAGADYVKTSTGFASGGATAEAIALMAKTVAPKKLGVKASGGIRTYDDAVRMIAAGATRIGASASVAIFEEAKARAPQKG